jgi:hypothetical protein
MTAIEMARNQFGISTDRFTSQIAEKRADFVCLRIPALKPESPSFQFPPIHADPYPKYPRCVVGGGSVEFPQIEYWENIMKPRPVVTPRLCMIRFDPSTRDVRTSNQSMFCPSAKRSMIANTQSNIDRPARMLNARCFIRRDCTTRFNSCGDQLPVGSRSDGAMKRGCS